MEWVMMHHHWVLLKIVMQGQWGCSINIYEFGTDWNSEKYCGWERFGDYQGFPILSKSNLSTCQCRFDLRVILQTILYQQMCIPEPSNAVWWEQMKIHVRKKMDERHSNCEAAIKKSILSNYQFCQSWFLCKLFSHILAHCINRFIRSKKSPYFRNNSAKEREPRVF